MHKRNRIVRIQATKQIGASCLRQECRDIIDVTVAGAAAVAIVYRACTDCNAQRSLATPVVDVAGYPLAEFHSIRRRRRALVVGDGQMGSRKFEDLVLVPLFRDAKHLEFYDRYIGRAIVTRNQTGALVRRAKIPPGYRKTLEWMLGTFARESNATVTRTVEVYAGIDAHRRKPQEIQLAVSEFRAYEAELQRRFGLSIRLLLQEESAFRSMVHARYVVTDQVGVFLDRGLDLLWSDPQMRAAGLDPATDEPRIRDVAISQLDDCSHVIS